MATYCPQCGQPNPGSSVDCSNCGYDLHQEPRPRPDPQAVRRPLGRAQSLGVMLSLSIAATLLCCLPTGVVAIVYTARAMARRRDGDLEAASHAARIARRWLLVSILLGLGSYLVSYLSSLPGASGG